MLGSEIAGQLRYQLDVKCLHAQVADYLCRSGNKVAALILERLQERGVDVRGDSQCQNQCNLRLSVAEASEGWWYTPVKNKWKLWRRRERKQLQAKRAAASSLPTC